MMTDVEVTAMTTQYTDCNPDNDYGRCSEIKKFQMFYNIYYQLLGHGVWFLKQTSIKTFTDFIDYCK